jgi:hypothetical protein
MFGGFFRCVSLGFWVGFYCQPCHKAADATPHKTAAVATATPRHQLSEREQIVILEAKLAQRDQEVKVRRTSGCGSGSKIRDPVPFFDPRGSGMSKRNPDPDPG